MIVTFQIRVIKDDDRKIVKVSCYERDVLQNIIEYPYASMRLFYDYYTSMKGEDFYRSTTLSTRQLFRAIHEAGIFPDPFASNDVKLDEANYNVDFYNTEMKEGITDEDAEAFNIELSDV